MTDALDFLVKGNADLPKIAKFISSIGFTVESLNQHYRHVVAKVNKDGKTCFFKMASREGLNVFIENDFVWSSYMQKIAKDQSWPLQLPKMYDFGTYENLKWLVSEYIEGEDGNENPEILNSLPKPMAEIIHILLKSTLPIQLPLDASISGDKKNFFSEKIAAYEQKVSPSGDALIRYLRENIAILEYAPSRGDLGPANVKRTFDGALYLIDSEYASTANMKFYDVAYFHYRLFVNAHRPDLADEFLNEFRALYDMQAVDEKLFKWVQVYRLLGGLNEALDEPFLLSEISKLREQIGI